MKITKGTWYQMGKTTVMSGYRSRTICKCRMENDAALIAEAGTVHNETGYTPRQLVEQKKALLDACEAQIACNKAKDNCEGCERESVCHGDMLPSFLLTAAIAKATT